MEILGRLENVNISFLTLVIVFCLFLQRSAVDSVSVFPSDTEAGIGQTVTMRCRITRAIGNDIEWHHTRYGLQKLNAVYLDGSIYRNYRGRFTVTGDALQGERNLRISNVNSEDAGKYICMHKTDSHPAELIVFATYPSSQSCAAIIPKDGLIGSNDCGLKPDNIRISCNYSYCGNKVPVVEWENARGSILPSELTTRADVNTSTLIQKAVKDDTFTCRIKYLSSDIQSQFSWGVSLNVQNVLHDVTVQKVGCDSQTVNCPTSRLPYQCMIEWNNRMLPNATLSTADLSDGLYTCIAQCYIRGKTCSIKQLTVDLNCTESSASTKPPSNQPKGGDSIAAIVIPVLIVLIIVAIVAVVAVILIRRRKTKTNRTKDADMKMKNHGREDPNSNSLLRKDDTVKEPHGTAECDIEQKIETEIVPVTHSLLETVVLDVDNSDAPDHDSRR